MWLELAGALAATTSAGMAWAVGARRSTVFGPSVWRGPRDRPWIALTFDDGPTPGTLQLLDLFDDFQVRATFFMLGTNVLRHPAIAREIARRGHQIGNHGHTHRRLFLRTPRFVAQEILSAQRAIIEVTGTAPCLFRPPYGGRWFGMRRIQRELGLLGVMWTAIGYDWKLRPEAILRRLLRYARNGAIFCLHDGRGALSEPDITSTVEAVRLLIPQLAQRGFLFKTVSQMLCPTN